MDSWFAAKENFDFILKKKKHFVAALKDNRLVALSADGKKQGRKATIRGQLQTDFDIGTTTWPLCNRVIIKCYDACP